MSSRSRSIRAGGQLVALLFAFALLLAFLVTAPAAVAGAKLERATHKRHASSRAIATGQRARAPHLSVSGDTLTWSPVTNASAYVLVRKVHHQADQYTTVHGTSITPPPTPGTTVDYSVRSAAYGSAWARERAITYPAAETTSAPSTPPTITPVTGAPATPSTPSLGGGASEAPTPPPLGGEPEAPVLPAQASNFQPGLNSGTNMNEDLQGAALLGAKLVRIGWSIATTPQEMQPVIAGYAAKGIRVLPLAEFYATMPSPAEAQDLAGWAKAFGPGGTFWIGRSDGQLAIQAIEFGNETASGAQYGVHAGESAYTALAQTYAVRLREAAEAIRATGVHVGLFAQEDDQTGDWINGMYAAVPNLTNYLAGWTIHPYGGEQYNRDRFAELQAQTAAHGASAIPIEVTEWGVTTDNGHCLEFNEGLNPCMSYAEAAQTLNSDVAWMTKLLGSRLQDFLLYQVRDQQPTGKDSNWQDYFGALQHQLQPKGAYTAAVESLLSS
jgi:hypothetical protein